MKLNANLNKSTASFTASAGGKHSQIVECDQVIGILPKSFLGSRNASSVRPSARLEDELSGVGKVVGDSSRELVLP